MDDVRLPIETTREGNKITKICYEDIYKILTRIDNALYKVTNQIIDIEESALYIDDEKNESWLIKGVGVSQPCEGDVFDEETGNRIAFMKAKLNANIKKHNLLMRIYKAVHRLMINQLNEELDKIDDLIMMDLNNLREFNPDYLPNLEYEKEIMYYD